MAKEVGQGLGERSLLLKEVQGKMKPIILAVLVSLLLSGCTDLEPKSVPSPVPEITQIPLGKMAPSVFVPEESAKFIEPWPSDVTRIELANTALAKAFEFFDSIQVDSCKIEPQVFVDDVWLEDHEQLLRNLAQKMTTTFCKYLTKDYNVLGGRHSFISKTIKEEKISGDFFKGCGGGSDDVYFSACAFDNVAWIVSLGTTQKASTFLEDRKITIAAHEIFHIFHDQIDPDPRGQIPPRGQEFFRPVWLIEGGGEFFGRVMPYYLGLIDYYGVFAPADRYGGLISKDYLGDLELMEVRRNVAFGTENYYAGQIALEYIIASKGVDALLGIWEKMGLGYDFDTALRLSIDLDTSEFYKRFAEMHSNLYAGDLVTNAVDE